MWHTRTTAAGLTILVAGLGLGASGCGSGNKPAATGVTAAGNGGGSATSNDGPTTVRISPVDAAYVAGLCSAMLAASGAAGVIAPSGPGGAQGYEKLAPVFARAADALAKLEPPGDAVASNSRIVAALRKVSADLAAGAPEKDPFAALESMTLPSALGKRLKAAAGRAPVCVSSGAHFDQNPLA